MREYITPRGSTVLEQWPGDIIHEDSHGSCNGPEDKLLPYGECFSWNPDFQSLWDPDDILPEIIEPTAEQLVKLYNRFRAICEKENTEKPKDEQLTSRELDEKAYKLMQEFLGKKKR